jgi:hypothetical protein
MDSCNNSVQINPGGASFSGCTWNSGGYVGLGMFPNCIVDSNHDPIPSVRFLPASESLPTVLPSGNSVWYEGLPDTVTSVVSNCSDGCEKRSLSNTANCSNSCESRIDRYGRVCKINQTRQRNPNGGTTIEYNCYPDDQNRTGRLILRDY